MNQKRREHARYLNEGLKDVEGIEIPYEATDVESNWAIYAIRCLTENCLKSEMPYGRKGSNVIPIIILCTSIPIIEI